MQASKLDFLNLSLKHLRPGSQAPISYLTTNQQVKSVKRI